MIKHSMINARLGLIDRSQIGNKRNSCIKKNDYFF